MIMYFETHAGLLAGKISLIDNDKIITQFNISTNNSEELISILAQYVSKYDVEYIKTNNPVYAKKIIEQKMNDFLLKEYNYHKYVRMECK